MSYDTKGKLITDIDENLTTWKNYVVKFFEDHREENLLEYTEMEADTGPEITKEEFKNALKSLNNNNAPGPDNIPAEILKLIEQEQNYVFVDLFNSIYKSGIIPEE